MSGGPGMDLVAGLPSLRWLDADDGMSGSTTAAEFDATGRELTLTAGPKTDWFTDPATGFATANAPVLAFDADGDFQLSAMVRVGFAATFDAGVLFLHRSAGEYAKLCFEFSPEGRATVVSVVTRGVSDDANGAVIAEAPVDGADGAPPMVRLRISAVGAAVAFHFSTDGTYWHLLRYFRLSDQLAPVRVGFCAQAPTGNSCQATFSEISYSTTTLQDPRNGS